MTKLPATMDQPTSVEQRAAIIVSLIVFIIILLFIIFSIVFAHHMISVKPI